MESKGYLLLVRNGTGAFTEKVSVHADIEFCKQMLIAMMRSSKKYNRGEIIEGNRDYIMDFRVKPIYKMRANDDGAIVEDNNN